MFASSGREHRRGFSVRFPRPATFEHPGLLYRTRDEYLQATTEFVRTAVGQRRPVLVAVPGPNLELLREALADLGDAVHFSDMTVAGRNPGTIIPNVLLAFTASHPGRTAIIGEPIWPGRTRVEYPACATHEALINAAFARHDAQILCPYDASRLHPQWLDDAWRTHPTMITSQRRRPSPHYTGPYEAAAAFNQPLPPTPTRAATITYTSAAALPAVHSWAADMAADLPAQRAHDLVAAVDELTSNTIVHTHVGGTLSIWWENNHLVCQVDDHGHLADPLAGRIPPPADTGHGRGLLLVNSLCDLVRIHTSPHHTSIRIHVYPNTRPAATTKSPVLPPTP